MDDDGSWFCRARVTHPPLRFLDLHKEQKQLACCRFHPLCPRPRTMVIRPRPCRWGSSRSSVLGSVRVLPRLIDGGLSGAAAVCAGQRPNEAAHAAQPTSQIPFLLLLLFPLLRFALPPARRARPRNNKSVHNLPGTQLCLVNLLGSHGKVCRLPSGGGGGGGVGRFEQGKRRGNSRTTIGSFCLFFTVVFWLSFHPETKDVHAHLRIYIPYLYIYICVHVSRWPTRRAVLSIV